MNEECVKGNNQFISPKLTKLMSDSRLGLLTWRVPTLAECINDPSIYVTPNFKYSELVKSSTADRLHIDNNMDETTYRNSVNTLIAVCEPIRYDQGAYSFSSFYRCEALEKAVNWGNDDKESSFAKWCNDRKLIVNNVSWDMYFAKKSHPSGEAGDFETSLDNKQLWERLPLILAEFVGYDQCILEFYRDGKPDSGWVHISWSDKTNRKQSFTIG